jgi:hypothetical protein
MTLERELNLLPDFALQLRRRVGNVIVEQSQTALLKLPVMLTLSG